MADQLIVRRWLVSLGRLTAVKTTSDEAAEFVDTRTPMLAMRFSDGAFTATSLEAVAAQCKYLPTYGELAEMLSRWWRTNRPMPVAISPPEPIRQRAEPTPEERAEVKRLADEAIAALRSSEQPPEHQRPRAKFMTDVQLDEAYRQAGAKRPRFVVCDQAARLIGERVP